MLGILAKTLADPVQFQQLSSFGILNSVGRAPNRLVAGGDGYLYGATSVGYGGGNGTIFRIRTNSTVPEILHNFQDDKTGFTTQQKIAIGSDNAVYGWAHTSGSSSGGTLFRVSLADHAFTPLLSAAQAQTGVWQELLEGSDHRLYAIANTKIVGVNHDGTGLKLLRESATLPSEIFESSDGKLYFIEGSAILRMNKDGSDVQPVHDFAAIPVPGAAAPQQLFEASDKFLYGTLIGVDDGTGPVMPRIFRLSRDGASFAVLTGLATFREGNRIYGNVIGDLIEGPDGNLFGTVASAGLHDPGYAFQVGKDGSAFAKLFDFPPDYLAYDSGADVNRDPPRYLVNGGDGLIYGSTQGSTTIEGFIYRFAPDGNGLTNLYLFNPPADSGANPAAPLVASADGSLYGVAPNGAVQAGGTVFRVNGGVISGLKSFPPSNSAQGLTPVGVTLASDGLLYGVTSAGGSDGFGTIFKMNVDATDFTPLRSFAATGGDGRVPQAPPIEATDHLLYGTTTFGGGAAAGTLFQIARDGSGYKTLVRFTNSLSGSNIVAKLLEANDGRIYGVTVFAGPQGGGTLFGVDKSGANLRILKAFSSTGTSLRNPRGALVQGADALLYGTASAGGSSGFGGVFSIGADGANYKVLREFSDSGGDGRQPFGGVVFGPDGYLYGTTQFGGGALNGSIFRLKPDGTLYEKLRGFSGNNGDGANPLASLVLASDGALYGTTANGGALNFGTLFRLTFGSASPSLTISQVSADLLRIEWPASATGFRLESTDTLGDAAAWTSSSSAAVVGNNFRVELNPSVAHQFFRLTKPKAAFQFGIPLGPKKIAVHRHELPDTTVPVSRIITTRG